MRRRELAHILRAACAITGDPDVLVIGSQSILGSFDEDALPAEATRSIEADIAFLTDVDEAKSDAVDGAIGELSKFHETYGIYGQGVGVATAILPSGWRERLVPFSDPEAAPSEALCLDPHDLVVSKLAAGREKDFSFAHSLITAGLIDVHVLRARAELLDGIPTLKRRVLEWVDRARETE